MGNGVHVPTRVYKWHPYTMGPTGSQRVYKWHPYIMGNGVHVPTRVYKWHPYTIFHDWLYLCVTFCLM
jgi:hypothetical protein